MSIGSSNFTALAFVEEDTYGVYPTGDDLQDIAFTGESFQFSKSSITSNNINSSRQVSDEVQTSFEVTGGVDIEISPGNYNKFIEGAMWKAFGDATDKDTMTVGVNATAGTFTADSGAPFEDLVPGQFFKIWGFTDAGNNGIFQIKTATDTIITVKDVYKSELTTTSSDESGISIRGRMIRNPANDSESVKKSFFFERRHTDLDPDQFFSFSGCLVNSFSLSAQSASLLTGSFDFMGKESEIYNSGAHDATTNPNGNGTGSIAVVNSNVCKSPMAFNGLNAVSHVGTVRIDGENVNTLAGSGGGSIYFQGIDFTLSNNLRGVQAIGQMGNVNVSPGQLSVTGNMNALFADDKMYRRFLSGEEFSLSFEIIEQYTDDTFGGYVFYMPRVTVKSSTMNAGGSDQDLVENMQFSALMDPTTNTSVQIDYIADTY